MKYFMCTIAPPDSDLIALGIAFVLTKLIFMHGNNHRNANETTFSANLWVLALDLS
jgi:hypothetical protein